MHNYNLKIKVLTLCVVLFALCGYSYAACTKPCTSTRCQYRFTGLTGTSSALDAVPVHNGVSQPDCLKDGDLAIGNDTVGFGTYVFNAASTDAESVPSVIQPNGLATGRWEKITGKLDTSNFNGILSATEDDVQKAMDVIDDIDTDNIPEGTKKFNDDDLSDNTQDDLPDGTTYKRYNPAANLSIGNGAVGVDFGLTINGEDNDFIAQWMEDENRLDVTGNVKFLNNLAIGTSIDPNRSFVVAHTHSDPVYSRAISTDLNDSSSWYFGRGIHSTTNHTGVLSYESASNIKGIGSHVEFSGSGANINTGSLAWGYYGLINLKSAGAYTNWGRVVGYGTDFRINNNSGAMTMTEGYYGYHVDYSYGDENPSYGITAPKWFGQYVENPPWDTELTITDQAGAWYDDQTRGTNNFGLVLDGDDYASAYNKTQGGASVWLGADQDAAIGYKSGEGLRFLIGQSEAQYKFTFGSGQAGIDYVLSIDGQTSDLNMTYDENAYKLLFDRNIEIANVAGTSSVSVRGQDVNIVAKRYGGTDASPTTVVADDIALKLTASGYDGSNYKNLGRITIEVDGTPSTGNDMPGRIVFLTSPDGSATPVERMRISNNGAINIAALPSGSGAASAGVTGTAVGTVLCLTSTGDLYLDTDGTCSN